MTIIYTVLAVLLIERVLGLAFIPGGKGEHKVTRVHPDLPPVHLRDDDCGDYHRWPR